MKAFLIVWALSDSGNWVATMPPLLLPSLKACLVIAPVQVRRLPVPKTGGSWNYRCLEISDQPV